MDQSLEYVYHFRNVRELFTFFLEKQTDVAFSFSSPSEFDGEFLPLLCYAHFFPEGTQFRLVRREYTIRDAEIKYVSGEVGEIQITQATDSEQMRNHNHQNHRDVFVAEIDTKELSSGPGIHCVEDKVGDAAHRVYDSLKRKIQNYKKKPEYKPQETILLIFLRDPSLLICFPPEELLSVLQELIPRKEIRYFKEVQIIYLQEDHTCSLVNLTTLSTGNVQITLPKKKYKRFFREF